MVDKPSVTDLAKAYWKRLGSPAEIVSIRERKDGSATVRWRDAEDGEVGDFHISVQALRYPTDPDYMAHEMRQRAAFERSNTP